MIVEYPEYLDRFTCIAGKCPDTCCAGWEVDVDDDMYYYYKIVGGNIGEKIRSHMVEDGEEKYFPLTPEGRCPFLDRENLCEIYRELGEESLCRVCTEYPRYYMQAGDYEQIDLSLSCMELGRIFFQECGRIRFIRTENEAAGDTISHEQEQDLQRILKDRDHRIAILQSSDMAWEERLKRAGLALEGEPDFALLEICRTFEVLNGSWSSILDNMQRDQEHMAEHMQAFRQAMGKKAEEWLEKLAVYLVFRYWIDQWYDEDPDGSGRMAARSLRLLQMMCAQRFIQQGGSFTEQDMIDIAHIFSRQVEHSDMNVEAMKCKRSCF